MLDHKNIGHAHKISQQEFIVHIRCPRIKQFHTQWHSRNFTPTYKNIRPSVGAYELFPAPSTIAKSTPTCWGRLVGPRPPHQTAALSSQGMYYHEFSEPSLVSKSVICVPQNHSSCFNALKLFVPSFAKNLFGPTIWSIMCENKKLYSFLYIGSVRLNMGRNTRSY